MAKEVEQLAESLRAMSDEEYYAMETKDGYETEREANVGKLVRGSQTKFRNK